MHSLASVMPAGSEVAAAAAEAGPPAGAGKKKRRTGAAAAATAAATPTPAAVTEEAAGSLQGHSQCVSGAAWADEGTVVSCSWDHSLRRFDVGSGTNTDTYSGSKALLTLALAPGSGGRLVAFGGADTAVRLWDVRAPGAEGGLGVRGFGGHGGWVAGLAWSRDSAHHFASASYDGSVKLWDARAAVPLATLEGHADKALAVAWWGGEGRLASGGADCMLRLYTRPQGGGGVAA
jgi:ribosome biogenesis protein YTM1